MDIRMMSRVNGTWGVRGDPEHKIFLGQCSQCALRVRKSLIATSTAVKLIHAPEVSLKIGLGNGLSCVF